MRQRSRRILCSLPAQLSARDARRGKQALRVLAAHHSWNPAEQSARILHLWYQMDWQCKKCQTRQLVSKEHCSKCGQHWSKVWQQRTPRMRQRSHSKTKSNASTSEAKEGQPDEDLAVFSTRTPWIATTPNSRVSTVTNATPPQSTVEAAKSKEENTALPPEPVLTISTCSRSSEAPGTSTWIAARHGHLATRVGAEATRSRGKDGRCRSQAQSRASQQDAKSAEAGDWHHREDSKARPGLADLCGSGGGKVSQAQRPFLGNSSQVGPRSSPKVGRAGHYQGRDFPCFSVFDECPSHGRVGRSRHRRPCADGIPLNAAMPLEVMDEYPDMDMDGDETEVPTRSTVGPFRRGAVATSPTKVAKEHLKTKENGKARPETPKS